MSSKTKDFALKYFSQGATVTDNERALRKAITKGLVKPSMSLREIGGVVGIEHPQIVKHFLIKFLEETNNEMV